MGWMGSQSDHHQDHVFKHRINGNGINNLNLRKWLVVFNGKLVGKYTIHYDICHRIDKCGLNKTII